ncbi:MAG: hypothetical protein KDE58_42625, partial [Caldilineaceae bacterium]|nr:hypothetical protein [Caldilineaceae bacterium]
MTQWTAEGGVIGYRAGRAQARGASVGLRPALMWLVLAGSLAWLGALLVPYQSYTSAALLIAVVLLPAVAIWVVTNAGVNGGGALAAMGLLVVLLSDWTVRGGADRDLDLQSVTKFAIWASGVILLIWRSSIVVQTARHLPSISLLAFGVWAVFSAAYSVSPLYSAAAGVAFIGIWMISTTLAVTASERLGLLVITLALLSGMVISLLLYLAFPDRVMVPMEGGTVLRLAGIFGSPNGMGRAAALALLTSLMLCYLLPRSRAALLMLM